jgi:hypothetical protein
MYNPPAWLVTYQHENGMKTAHLVYKPQALEELVNNAPKLVIVKIKAMGQVDLARPEDGDESI